MITLERLKSSYLKADKHHETLVLRISGAMGTNRFDNLMLSLDRIVQLKKTFEFALKTHNVEVIDLKFPKLRLVKSN